MELFEAVTTLDYKSFTQLLSNGADVTSRDENGNTVLHLLAKKAISPSIVQELIGIFIPPVTLSQWLATIKNRLPDKSLDAMAEFATIQNNNLCTCMHVAIENQNWWFASFLQDNYLQYSFKLGRFRRNKYGLNEYEMFLMSYGHEGRRDEFRKIFDGFGGSLFDVKRAAKAFKIIKLVPHGRDPVSVFLGIDHPHFKKAVEDEHPSPYASIDDPDVITQIYSDNGLEDPSLRALKRDKVKLPKLIESLSYLPIGEGLECFSAFLADWSEFLSLKRYDYSAQNNLLNFVLANWEDGPPESEYVVEEIIAFKNSPKAMNNAAYIPVFEKLLAVWKQ